MVPYGRCCDSAHDVIAIAKTIAPKLNLTIYQKEPKGNIQIFEQDAHATGKEVHLKFIWNSCNLANSHYEAILLLHKSAQIG